MANKKAKDSMDAVLANIEKQMGNKGGKKSPFSRFGNIEQVDVPVIPFGISDIDAASYCGGVLRGKMVEIFGPESSGKSLLTLHLIAEAQKQGLEAALLDVEQSFDPLWAARHGVDVDNLVYSNDFDNGEQALEYAIQFTRSGAFGIVVIEANACGVPVVTFSFENNASMDLIRNGHNGYVCKPTLFELNRYINLILKKNLAQKCISYSKAYNINIIASKLEDYYMEVLKNH